MSSTPTTPDMNDRDDFDQFRQDFREMEKTRRKKRLAALSPELRAEVEAMLSVSDEICERHADRVVGSLFGTPQIKARI